MIEKIDPDKEIDSPQRAHPASRLEKNGRRTTNDHLDETGLVLTDLCVSTVAADYRVLETLNECGKICDHRPILPGVRCLEI